MALCHHRKWDGYASKMKVEQSYLFRRPGALSDILTVLQPVKDFLHDSFLLLGLLHFETLATDTGLLLLVLYRLLGELDIFCPHL